MAAIPISEFEHRVARWVTRLKKQREPLHITQRGKPALVVLSQDLFEEWAAERKRAQAIELRMLIEAGERDIAAGRVYSQEQVEKRLRQLDRKSRRKS